MTRIVSLVCALALLFCLSCAAEQTGMPNPMTEIEDLAALNELAGVNLVRPAVMGVTEEKCFAIDCGEYILAEYDFEVNGNPWCFRSACVLGEDISGLYGDEGEAFGNEPSDDLVYFLDADVMAARWFTLDGQYVLICKEPSAYDGETFGGIVQEMRDQTDPAMNDSEIEAFYEALAGNWADSVSERAVAELTPDSACGIRIEVSWADSAFDTNVWVMNAALGEEGLLSYDDLTETHITTDDEGNEASEIIREGGSGYLSYHEEEGILYWDGADDEALAGCAFVRIPEE